MTVEEAINRLKKLITGALLNVSVEYAKNYEEAIQQGISALEKQVAKKPRMKQQTKYQWLHGNCPECICGVTSRWDYCQGCGQKLDWSEI